jgi:hypothetical protein
MRRTNPWLLRMVSRVPTLKIFKKGGSVISEYKGPREAAGIVAHLKQLVGPPSQEITSAEQAEEIVKKSQLTVVSWMTAHRLDFSMHEGFENV